MNAYVFHKSDTCALCLMAHRCSPARISVFERAANDCGNITSMCMCAGEECRDDPLPVSPKVWAALNRRLFYVLIINGFFGRSMEWFWLKRLDILKALLEGKDFIVCDWRALLVYHMSSHTTAPTLHTLCPSPVSDVGKVQQLLCVPVRPERTATLIAGCRLGRFAQVGNSLGNNFM